MKRPLLWLIDGHNLIFQFSELEELQVSGRRAEARRDLESLLRAFALDRGERVVIVYDGNMLDKNPDAVQEELFATIYTSPPEEADDRIVYLARTHIENNDRVLVVTSDVRTLANDLPETAIHMTAGMFRQRHLTERQEGKQAAEGDFSDLEAEFLRADAEAPPPTPRKVSPVGTVPPSLPAPIAARAKPQHGPPVTRPSPDPAAQERIRLKKEKGLRHQKRRLQRRGKKKR